jgi:DNA polymerase III alpha subunit
MKISEIKKIKILHPEYFLSKSAEIDFSKLEVVICATITEINVIKPKSTTEMAFVHLEDETGKIQGLIFPKCYSEFKKFIVVNNGPLIIEGNVNLLEEPPKIFPHKIGLA